MRPGTTLESWVRPLFVVASLVLSQPVHAANSCAGVSCAPAGSCFLAGTCDPAIGACSVGAPKPAGTKCSERSTCLANAHCDGAGQCVGAPKPAGTRCSDRNGCTFSDRCDGAGQCVGAPKPAGNRCND